jgi:hypothetical protein
MPKDDEPAGDNGPKGEPRPEIHRDICLTAPHMHGADVRQLQHRCNEIQDTFDSILAYKVKEDSDAGEHSFNVFWHAAHVMGLGDDHLRQIRHGTMDQVAQRHVRQPDERGEDAIKRSEERRDTMRERLRKAEGGAAKAVEWARSKIGVTESPSGSNWGPQISDWITFTGYGSPVFWCGCFVAYAVVNEGGAAIPTRVRLGFDGHINADARANANGLELIPSTEAQAGDVVTFNFAHIALCAGPVEGGLMHTIDGNTSSSTGNDNNGGGVFEKRRALSFVTSVARPAYGG